MVGLMHELGFGNCSNEAECEAGCPKRIGIANIARLNREAFKAHVQADGSPLGIAPARSPPQVEMNFVDG